MEGVFDDMGSLEFGLLGLLGGVDGLNRFNARSADGLLLPRAGLYDLNILKGGDWGLKSASMDAEASLQLALTSDSVDIVTGIPTTITNGNEGMISSRFQDHSWVTADGAVHIMANTNNRLTLYSSSDSGQSWNETATLENSSGSSRADGLLVNDKLYHIYTTCDGGINLTVMNYSADNVSWTVESSTALPSPSSLQLDRPSIAITKDGTIVVTCTATDRSTGQAGLRVGYSNDEGNTWNIVEQQIKNTKNDDRMSGDVIATDDGVGILYSNGFTLNWADYSETASPGSRVEVERILVKGDTQNDPNGTHFSSLTDVNGNIHVATNNGEGQVVYLRYNNAADTWDDPVEITAYQNSGDYMQISVLDDGSIQIVYNVSVGGERFLEVSESLDGGDSWAVKARLTQNVVAQPGNLRMETPAYGQDSLIVFQQIETTDGANSLVYYEVN